MRRTGGIRTSTHLLSVTAAALVGLVTVLALVALGPSAALAAPPDTISDFYPENANLSDCVGLVEKPGCGSEARGGWAQFAIFGIIVVAFGLIAWRISIGLRANRDTASDSNRPTADDTTT